MDKFLALAEPTRRHIIEMLADSSGLTATTIYNHFQVSHPAISQHLRVLRETNLVIVEKHAQQRIYRINVTSFQELQDWVSKMSKLWSKRLDKLNNLLTQGSDERSKY